MQLPTIHLNGTSAVALAEGYETAARSLSKAIECLQDAAPNARDYYPAGNAAWSLAQKEHEARITSLRAIYTDLQALYEHVQNAGETE